MNYAVILAGGIGSRFWPISTINTPKQILKITGRYTPLQKTVRRISDLVGAKNVFIIANSVLEQEVRHQTSKLQISSKNIFIEPSRKNTMLPIAWAAYKLYKIDRDSTMIILPADHAIEQKDEFLATIKKAIKLASLNHLVTLGIKPDCPDTAYGYIKSSKKVNYWYKVEKFIEKPSLDLAKEFVKNSDYFWNSGIFIWKTKTILSEIKKFLPYIYQGIVKSDNEAEFRRFWKKAKPLSIDYGIMEKSKKISLIPANFKWIDVGSWDALHRVLKKDNFGNVTHGKSINLDSSGLIIWSDDRMPKKRLIAAVGLKDLIIVESNDAILVCHKNKAQDVKKISEILNKK